MQTTTFPADGRPAVTVTSLDGLTFGPVVFSLEHAAKEATIALARNATRGATNFDIVETPNRKGGRLLPISFSTARLSQTEILGFADRPRGRGALIVGDCCADLLLDPACTDGAKTLIF
jgi:hypothetical protein